MITTLMPHLRIGPYKEGVLIDQIQMPFHTVGRSFPYELLVLLTLFVYLISTETVRAYSIQYQLCHHRKIIIIFSNNLFAVGRQNSENFMSTKISSLVLHYHIYFLHTYIYLYYLAYTSTVTALIYSTHIYSMEINCYYTYIFYSYIQYGIKCYCTLYILLIYTVWKSTVTTLIYSTHIYSTESNVTALYIFYSYIQYGNQLLLHLYILLKYIYTVWKLNKPLISKEKVRL